MKKSNIFCFFNDTQFLNIHHNSHYIPTEYKCYDKKFSYVTLF
jgi:hypothetical protein